MGETTGIEWTESTWNPVAGCSMAPGSELKGCLNCYAARRAANPFYKGMYPKDSGPFAVLRDTGPRWTGRVQLIPERLLIPYRWKKGRLIFVCSMSDLLHENLAFGDIALVWAAMAAAPWHTYQVLTKRASRLPEFFEWLTKLAASHAATLTDDQTFAELSVLNIIWLQAGGPCALPKSAWPLPHVQVGVSVEDQPTADERIFHLLATPAAVRFVSHGPALGRVDFWQYLGGDRNPIGVTYGGKGLDWLICEGESGPEARPMHPDIPRSDRDQCIAAGVPFLFKQWGNWTPDQPADFHRVSGRRYSHETFAWGKNGQKYNPVNPDPDDFPLMMFRVSKHKAGRLLDGREWNEFPGPGGTKVEIGQVLKP
jgi:protein gp37